jgi:hypothetical protein
MPLAPRMNMAAYVVTRSLVVAPVNGRPSAPTTSSVNITANVQPADGETLKVVPEARYAEDLRVVFTSTELYCERNGYLPDIVTIAGERFEVIKVRGPCPGHYEVIVSKVDRP